MAKTETKILSDAWEEVLGGDTVIAIQPTGQGQFRVAVLPTGVQPNAETRGIVCSSVNENLPGEFTGAGIPAGTLVFVRSFDATPVEVVVVTY